MIARSFKWKEETRRRSSSSSITLSPYVSPSSFFLFRFHFSHNRLRQPLQAVSERASGPASQLASQPTPHKLTRLASRSGFENLRRLSFACIFAKTPTLSPGRVKACLGQAILTWTRPHQNLLLAILTGFDDSMREINA